MNEQTGRQIGFTVSAGYIMWIGHLKEIQTADISSVSPLSEWVNSKENCGLCMDYIK